MQHRGWIAPLLLAVLCAACSPDVRGTIIPNPVERARLGGQRVEVRLIRGNLLSMLDTLTRKHQKLALLTAQGQFTQSSNIELAAKTEALTDLRATLVSDAGEGIRTRSTRDCLPLAERALRNSRLRLANLVKQLKPQLAELGISSTDVATTISQLRPLVEQQLAAEAQRVRDEYVAKRLPQRSWTVLASGGDHDRLCWSVDNNGEATVGFHDLEVTYNGTSVPQSVANGIWALPDPRLRLRVANSNGQLGDLLPGGHYETCFYARRSRPDTATLAPFGLGTSPTRGGEWRVRWQSIEFSDAKAPAAERKGAAGGSAQPVPLVSVFAAQLRHYEQGMPIVRMIEILTNSDHSHAIEDAQEALLRCHRAIELEKEQAEIVAVLRAFEKNKFDDIQVKSRLRPVVSKVLQDSERTKEWGKESQTLIDAVTVRRQTYAPGDNFRFKDLPAGDYTLVAESIDPTGKMPKLWLLPVHLESKVQQDLVMAAARSGSLADFVRKLLF